MSRLPPKPEVPPIVAQSLVVAALSTGCAVAPPRIGQPPVDVPPECELRIVDEAGEGIAGVRVEQLDGGLVQTNEDGWVSGRSGDVQITHPGYADVSAEFCGPQTVTLVESQPVDATPTQVPVRIGRAPARDESR